MVVLLQSTVWRVAALIAALTVFVTGCATWSADERGPTRDALDQMGERTLATLAKKEPDFETVLEQSIGYAVLDMSATKIPVIGTGRGYGIVVDRRSTGRSYVQISRFEIGGGIGAQQFKVAILFQDPDLLARAASGTWHYGAGAELGAGEEGAQGRRGTSGPGYRAFRLSEGGAVASVTVRIARARPYVPGR